MSFKLVAIDLDGTLLTSWHEVTPRTIRAIQETVRRGVHVILASARMPRSILHYSKQLELHSPIIAYSGAMIVDPETETAMHIDLICPSAAEEIIELARLLDLHVSLYIDDEWYIERLDSAARAESEAAAVLPTVVKDLKTCARDGVAKGLFIGAEHLLTKAAAGLNKSKVSFSHSKPYYLEITRAGTSKGRALQILGQMLSVKRQEMLAIGDGSNDLEMLCYAGYSVAVDNAPDDLKKQVDFIAPSNDQEGVAFTLQELILMGSRGG